MVGLPMVLDCREIVYGNGFPTGVDEAALRKASADPEIAFCASVVSWLLDTGYFKGSSSIHGVRVTAAVLSPKGFEALAATPKSLSGKGPVGRQLAKLAKDAGKDTAKKLLGDALGFVFSAGVKFGLG